MPLAGQLADARREYDRAKERLERALDAGAPQAEIARRREEVKERLSRVLHLAGKLGAVRARGTKPPPEA
jgi:hypothetical protein